MKISEVLNSKKSDFHDTTKSPFHTSYLIFETGSGDQFGGSDSWFHVSWSEKKNKFSLVGYIKNSWNIRNHFSNPDPNHNEAIYWYAKMDGGNTKRDMVYDYQSYQGHYKAEVHGKTGGALEGLASSIMAIKLNRK